MELDFGAAIELGVSTSLEKNKHLFQNEAPKPRFLSVPGSGVGNVLIPVGRPPAGKLWNILTITIVGNDDHTTATGAVSIYVDSDNDSNSLGLAACRVPALAIPSFTSISRGTLWAHNTGNVVANVTGASGTQNVLVTTTVAEWNVTDISTRSTR